MISPNDFGDPKYWENNFKAQKNCFEWYMDFEGLENEILQDIKEFPKIKCNILIPGGGTSTLSCSLYEKGYNKITHSDVSKTCINEMNKKYSIKYPNLIFETNNILKVNNKNLNFFYLRNSLNKSIVFLKQKI